MDRNELNLKMEELKTAMHNRDFEKAVDIADTLDLKKIKDNNFLSLVADAYELTHKYKEAKKVLLFAYENTNAGRHLAYRLCLIAIKNKEFDEAREFYEDFVEMAPRDTTRYILKYKMAKAKGTSIEKLIEILEEYVNIDMEEKWAYELAKLYHMAGDEEKCVDMCDEISLWFSEGKYVIKAMELKKMYRPLTSTQQQKYEENKKKSVEEAAKSEKEKVEKKSIPFTVRKEEIQEEPEIEIKPMGEEKFNTMEIQEVIARGMKEVEIKEEPNIHEGAEATKVVPVPVEKDNVEEVESRDSEIVEELETVEKLETVEELETEPIKDLHGVENILRQLQERGILKAETVKQAVDIIGETEEQEEPKARDISTSERWAEDNKPVEITKNNGGIKLNVVEPPKSEEIKKEPVVKAETGKVSGVPVFDLSFEAPERDSSNDVGQENMYEDIVANSDLGNSTDKLPSREEIEEAVKDAEKAMEKEEQASKEQSQELEKTDEATDLRSKKNLSAKVEIISGADWEQPEIEEHAEDVIENSEEHAEENAVETTEKNVEEAGEKVKTADKADETEEKVREAIPVVEDDKEPEKENDAAQEEEIQVETKLVLTEEELSAFKNYLNVEGFESNIREVLQKLIADYNPNGKSETGNVIIMGAGQTGKTTLAIEMIKLVNRKRGRLNRKLAKIDASALNRRGFRNSLSKLLGCDLIVENAQNLGAMTLSEVIDATGMFTDDMLIVLEGETEGMERILEESPRLAAVFNHVIKIKEYDIKEWVDYGIRYAQSKGYSVDELANRAFFKAVDDFFGNNNGIGKKDVEAIVDSAIDKSERLGRKITGIFSSRKDENGLYILVESDFNI